MGSWLTIFHQLQLEKDLNDNDLGIMTHNHEPLLLLAVLIISAPKNFDLRDTLRSTWLKLNPSKTSVRHYFVVGTEGLDEDLTRRLHQEQTVQGDMLLLSDLTDNYDNLTLKITRSLTYLTLTSPTPFQYVMKCDDDSFARLDAIASELEERQISIRQNGYKHPNNCFYWGFFDGRAKVQKRGKWKEEHYKLCDMYLPYALGGGYILSKKCSDFIVRNQAVLKAYRNEDVTIGTWLSTIDHEKRYFTKEIIIDSLTFIILYYSRLFIVILLFYRHDVRFDTEFESRGCSNKYIVQHKLTQAEMTERYNNLITKGSLCTQEVRRKPSYEYQWQLPPSKCCTRDATVI